MTSKQNEPNFPCYVRNISPFLRETKAAAFIGTEDKLPSPFEVKTQQTNVPPLLLH